MRRLLRDVAYEHLRDRIVFGEDPPGTVLREAELADAIGVSKAPIREALARLSAEGLVERKAQSHTRVTDLDTRITRDAVSLIQLLHTQAVSIARLYPEDFTRMRAANDRFIAAIRARDVRTALAADDDFHGVIIERADNLPLTETIDRWSPQIRRLEARRFTGHHGKSSVRRHLDLVDALTVGDTPRAMHITSALFGSLHDELDATDSN
jgi:DNA-binding GntR family transcriptional regulator